MLKAIGKGRLITLQHATGVDVLRRALIFSSLSEDELAELSRIAVERSFGTGEFVFWDGDKPDWLYIVAEGNIKVL